MAGALPEEGKLTDDIGVTPAGLRKWSPSALRAGRAIGVLSSIALTLMGLLLLTFLLARFLPADPVYAIIGDNADRDTYERVYRELGLDQPVYQQFFTYALKVVTGDLGMSHITGMPVVRDLLEVVPATLELAIVAIILGSAAGIPLGVLAGTNQNKPIDHVVRIIGLIGYSTPAFWAGMGILIIFYAQLGWIGGAGRQDPYFFGEVPTVTRLVTVDALLAGRVDIFLDALRYLVAPALILAYNALAYISRMTRSFMLEQMNQEYVVTAKAKGLSRGKVIWAHAFVNIRVQLVTIVALTFGAMLEGAVLVETVFAWPGLGQYLTRGLMFRDMNVVLGSVLVIGIFFIILNMLADFAYRQLDPRTR
ncbi:ABC transporter permease [Devosia ginsengisoli]|uniref:ABC transporter permease n=1 Tax=Devosia ginsengisoli TaxID=400770 RepID=UPI0026F1E35C|nr:ABC transporter permease [Devosia ginsengisoli]MCR6670762.1 ABC transporter permease [Devosia ginsengisoli]